MSATSNTAGEKVGQFMGNVLSPLRDFLGVTTQTQTTDQSDAQKQASRTTSIVIGILAVVTVVTVIVILVKNKN
jgi:hypothetical protein